MCSNLHAELVLLVEGSDDVLDQLGFWFSGRAGFVAWWWNVQVCCYVVECPVFLVVLCRVVGVLFVFDITLL